MTELLGEITVVYFEFDISMAFLKPVFKLMRQILEVNV